MRTILALSVVFLGYTTSAQVQYERLAVQPTTFINSSWEQSSVDAAGNTFVIGVNIGGVTFPEGTVPSQEHDIVVVKYDPAGTLLWWRNLRASWFDQLHDHALDANGNLYVACLMNGDLPTISGSGMDDTTFAVTGNYIIRFAADGTFLGADQMPVPTRIAIHEGFIYRLVGNFSPTLQKVTLGGTLIWSTPIEDAGYMKDVVVTDDGSAVYVVASATEITCQGVTATSDGGDGIGVVRVSADGICTWAYAFGPVSVVSLTNQVDAKARADGGLYIAAVNTNTITYGGATLLGGGSTQAHLFAIDATGEPLWGRSINSSVCTVKELKRTGDDVYYLTMVQNNTLIGDTMIAMSGQVRAAVVRYSPTGNVEFLDVSLRGTSFSANTITAPENGGYILAGRADLLSNGCHTLHEAGTFLWSARFAEVSAVVEGTPTLTLDGNTLLATTDGAFDYTYSWELNDDLLSDATESSTAISANGSYQVIITNQWGCNASSEPYLVNTVGFGDGNADASFHIGPVPADRQLTIQASGSGPMAIAVHDAAGSLMHAGTSVSDLYVIDTASWPSGLYVVRSLSAAAVGARSFIVQH